MKLKEIVDFYCSSGIGVRKAVEFWVHGDSFKGFTVVTKRREE